jgi:hypothetical protein
VCVLTSHNGCAVYSMTNVLQYGPGLSFVGRSALGQPLLPTLRKTTPTLLSDHAAVHLGSPCGFHNSMFYGSGLNHVGGGTNVTLREPTFPEGLADLQDGKNMRVQIYNVFAKSLKEGVRVKQHWNLHELSSRGSHARSLVCPIDECWCVMSMCDCGQSGHDICSTLCAVLCHICRCMIKFLRCFRHLPCV